MPSVPPVIALTTHSDLSNDAIGLESKKSLRRSRTSLVRFPKIPLCMTDNNGSVVEVNSPVPNGQVLNF